jgi:hypothetical protein
MKGSRRFLGYGAIAAGAAGILVGASPLFPVFLEAFVVGGALIAVGLWVLAGPELRASLRKAARLKVSPRSSARRPPAPRVVIDPLLPVRILRLAREHRGILTVAEVAMGLSVPLDQAEAGLSECVRAGNAMPDYDIPRAHALYRFPEFIEPDEQSR